MKIKLYILVLLFFSLFLSSKIFCQKYTKIHLIHADELTYNKKLGENIRRLIGDVIFKHDSTFLYCDSAYLDDETNNVKAFSNVHIKVSDTLNLYGDILNYNGNTQIAEIHNNVKLIDKHTTLITDNLIYNRKTKIATYYKRGNIIDKKNQLTSIKGYYHTDKKEFFFSDSVVVISPENIINSDTLMYNTISKITYFYGHSTMKSKENFISFEQGWYNTMSDISQLKKNIYIINLVNKSQTLSCDSIYYEPQNGIEKAFKNVTLTDTIQNIILKGNLLYYYKNLGYSIITDSALAIIIKNNDSLFLHADTLKSTFDSTQTAKKFYAYYKIKFYRKDIQGMCDSLVYKIQDSTISLYNKPVLWSDKNQLSADSIKIKVNNKEIKTMSLFNSSFIISQDSTKTYNQIKGKNMIGYFYDNKLKKIKVKGNAQTLYFVRENNGELIGINKTISSNMIILFLDNKIASTKYLDHPDATLHPKKELSAKDILLKGFKWVKEKRPEKTSDTFIW